MENTKNVTFLTPYWNGEEMVRIHLQSIRKYYPDAPILVSKFNGGLKVEEEEKILEGLKNEFNIEYWMDESHYVEAMRNLYARVKTDIVVISDHDVVLLDNIDYLINGVGVDWDLVGIEERIHHPWADTWQRYYPGMMDMTFMIFNLKEYSDKFGMGTIHSWNKERPDGHSSEGHYSLCENLKRHKYLLPYHTEKYGMGNLLKDGDRIVAWHQWYGSYRERSVDNPAYDRVALFGGREFLGTAEQAFLRDYPNLDLNNLRPAYDDRQ